MSRDFQDPHGTREDQSELAFAQGGSRGGAREAEPSRAEFFRTPRRPILPIVGLVGAIATVAAFLWFGRDEAPETAVAPEPTAPVASAPDFEVPFPEAPQPAAGPAPVAEAAMADAAAPLPAEVTPGAPDPTALGTGPALPPVAAAAAPIPAPAIAAPAAAQDRPAVPPPAARKASPAGRGGYSIQLLAARSETQVGGAWNKLRGAHPDLLASLSPNVSATERSGSGTFYRLRAGPLHDRAAADALCKKLSARNQSCFVVVPGS
jgi:hypothetical protein